MASVINKGSGSRSKIPCRCKKCYKRKSLARRPEHYQIVPACPRCGNRTWYVDYARMNNPDVSSGGRVCYEDCMTPIHGKDFQHRVNTKGCRYYEDWLIERAAAGSNAGATTDNEPGF